MQPPADIHDRVTRVESEIESIADTVGKLAEAQARSHAETQSSIRHLATSTTEALADVRDRIADGREANPTRTIAIVGLLWTASVVLVGWGASVHSTAAVNAGAMQDNRLRTGKNEADIEKVEGRVASLEAACLKLGDSTARNAADVEWVRGMVLEVRESRNTAADGVQRDAILRDHAERIAKVEARAEGLADTVREDKDDLDDLRPRLQPVPGP